MNILVTGGAGFIGSHLVDALLARGHAVTIYDALDPQVHPDGPPAYLAPEARFIQGDVRDRDALAAALDGAQVVFHEAAAVGVGQSQYQIRHYVEVNSVGTATLLDILANDDHKVRKLVVAASMSSYGEGAYDCAAGCGVVQPALRQPEATGPGRWEPPCPRCGGALRPVPTPESHAQQATSIYALTKREQEAMALVFGVTYRVPVVALRYFNVYGPRQSLSNPYTGVLAIFLSRLKNGQPPVVYEDGEQSRDFVSVHDIVAANLLAMERDTGDYARFNVGGGSTQTVAGVARALARAAGVDLEPQITQTFRKGDVRHCAADLTRIGSALGYAPAWDFERGLAELVAWSSGVEAVDRFEEAAAELRRRGLAGD